MERVGAARAGARAAVPALAELAPPVPVVPLEEALAPPVPVAVVLAVPVGWLPPAPGPPLLGLLHPRRARVITSAACSLFIAGG